MIESKIPMSRAIIWILVSTLLVSGSAFMSWLYYLHVRERRFNDDQYRIVALIQSTSQPDALKTVYLAEMLNLSLDRPVNLYQFNIKEATETLLSQPLIKEATIKKILPGTLYIHYQMRKPHAYIGDFANTAIDQEGYIFPFRPFFTPKLLPILYLGLNKEECKWGNHLEDLPSVQLAFSLLRQFARLQKDNRFCLKQLDVTQARADSYGQRQIVMVLEEKDQKKKLNSQKPLIFLRLSSDHAEQDLINFCDLKKFLFEKDGKALAIDAPLIFDLRIPHLAFIKTGY